MAKRLDIKYNHTTSSSVSSSYCEGMRDSYMLQYGRLMLVNKTLYKFNGVVSENRIITKVKRQVVDKSKKAPDVDISRLVILGGTFEEIGGKDEAIGGGSQKVGSANK